MFAQWEEVDMQRPQCCELTLTDGDFVLFSQHDVVWRQVAVDYSFFLVQIPQCQAHLRGEMQCFR